MSITAAECSKCGRRFSQEKALTVCQECGGALLFRYDLARIAEHISRGALKKREDTFWKFKELLPVSSRESIISLGEPYTPVLQLSNSTTKLPNVYAKDDGRLPTGTFKARGMAVAVSKLKELGVDRIAVPSAGNAATALAAYGARAGMKIYVLMPKDVPRLNLKECVLARAEVFLVDGLISDAAELTKKLERKFKWFDLSTNKQPYRVEGCKTMAFEIAEQFAWDPPDNIFFPTGGGEGIIGLWKGFEELMELSWIERIPRLILVQSSGCAPLVEAYERGKAHVEKAWENAETMASGLRVPLPFASNLTLRALRETGGTAVAVEDREIISSMKHLLQHGISACPEAASTLAALNRLHNDGLFDQDEKKLLYMTGNATRYIDAIEVEDDETLASEVARSRGLA